MDQNCKALKADEIQLRQSCEMFSEKRFLIKTRHEIQYNSHPHYEHFKKVENKL